MDEAILDVAQSIQPYLSSLVGEHAALVEAAFDLYRQDLYTQLRWSPPTSPHDEHGQGRPVTTYLLRGSDATTPLFTPLQAAEPPPLPWPAAEGVSRPESAQQGDRDQPS